mmetsp:Transcript_9270/g.11709  ORF Transcript_9270/g.11709 Transcript_9270/m.11709 type:complete len:269 (-) Transcript_9270:34-840(-)
MEDEDEFDQVSELPINDGNGTTYYAKNDNYNFSTQGHANRRNEMEKLHQNHQFTQWERASKKEWAVVHAKFYISLPQRTRRGLQNRSKDGHTRSRELEALPEQASVIDVKSAENATLGTKFMSTGLSNQNTRRSAVRMNRIHGINDDVEWKGGPLFEKKLFYRSEDIVSNQGPNNDDDDSMVENEIEMEMNKQSANDNGIELNMYKNEKLSQVRQYNVESELLNPDNAARLLHECCSAIEACQNAEDIDTIVQTYYSEIVKYEFNRNT